MAILKGILESITIEIATSLIGEDITPPPVGTWILATGSWDDLGFWDDSETWNDS